MGRKGNKRDQLWEGWRERVQGEATAIGGHLVDPVDLVHWKSLESKRLTLERTPSSREYGT